MDFTPVPDQDSKDWDRRVTLVDTYLMGRPRSRMGPSDPSQPDPPLVYLTYTKLPWTSILEFFKSFYS